MIDLIKPEFCFSDDRGSMFQLFSNGWKQANISYTKKNVERGSHYHKQNKEVFFIIEGSFKIDVENIKTGERVNKEVHKGDMFVIYPFEKHTFSYIEDTIMFAAYDIGFVLPDGTKDVFE